MTNILGYQETKMKVCKSAFTLAEVLITLGIIGIVSALTLPSIINHFKVKQLESAFKTADALIQQAIQKSVNEIGYDSINDFNRASSWDNAPFEEVKQLVPDLNEAYLKQFKIIKKLDPKINELYYKNAMCHNMFGKTLSSYNGCYYSTGTPYIISNGMLVSTFTATKTGANHPVLVETMFDTNGPFKGPNRIGYDIFTYKSHEWLTMCNPTIQNSYNTSHCYYYAHRNLNPIDSSKPYWDILYKPLSYWKK